MAESTNLTYDLPANFRSPNDSADLIDENFGTYYLQEQGNAEVKKVKFLVRKDAYNPATLGTSFGRGLNLFLIKEDEFTDIGGGYATFVRHYARLPDPWYDFEKKTTMVYEQGDTMGFNYDSFYGRNSFGNYSFGRSGAIRNNITYLAKATRYYVTTLLVDLYAIAGYTIGRPFAGSGSLTTETQVFNYGGVVIIKWARGNFSGSFLRPNILDDNTFLVYPEIYDFNPYPEKLYINAPMGTINKSDSREMVIAPDRIRLWQPGIYEITRYTSVVNLVQSSETDRVPIQVFYQIEDQQNVTQEELQNLQVELFGDENVYANPLTYYLFKDLANDADKESNQEIEIEISSADPSFPNDFEVKRSGIIVNGATIEDVKGSDGSSTDDPFTKGSIVIKWNTIVETITVNITLSRKS